MVWIVPNYRGDSQARHSLSPCKQREGPQTELPCSGRTGQTAAASPAAAEQIKKIHCSESAVTGRVDEAGRADTKEVKHAK